jgi:hypothetical protein
MSEQSTDEVGREVIGYVVGDTEEAVTLCTDREPEWDEDIPRAEIRDGPHYGTQVPRPECFLCARVIRPHDTGSDRGVSND